jgi:signal peptidase I
LFNGLRRFIIKTGIFTCLEELLDSNYPETAPEQEPIQTPRQRPVWIGILWEVLQTLIMAVILYFLIDAVVGRVRVENISMQPTLHQDQFILVNKLAYRLGSFQRGDIIVFHFPGDPKEDYIKRVIGLPGETVDIKEGHVFVNGQLLDETYIAAPPNYVKSYQVPPDGIFVLGDNRNQSSDSHLWGYVPAGNVVGKALVVYWPIGELKILNQVPTVSAANK